MAEMQTTEQRELKPDCAIWRYMSLAKFVSLLSRSELFVPTADRLGDPHEGAFTELDLMDLGVPGSPIERAFSGAASRVPELAGLPLEMKSWGVSCWHLNDGESHAMWGLYVSRAAGVAIRSTPDRVARATEGSGRTIIPCQTVQYIGYGPTEPAGRTLPDRLFKKRKPFQHEQEVRFLVDLSAEADWFLFMELVMPGTGLSGPSLPQSPDGIFLRVDLEVLIDGVVVAPAQNEPLFEAVSAVAESFGLGGEIVQRSVLEDPPPYVVS